MNVEELDVLQADVDDESGQVLGAFVERAMAEGALDAHLTPLLMKKGRPGVRIEVLCRPADRDRFLRLMMTGTTTLGVKVRRLERYSLDREIFTVTVRGERIRVKVAYLEGVAIKAAPEFEDCRAAALRLGEELRVVMEESKAQALVLLNRP